MAQEELPGVLYDFLYRDDNRIASYYAQTYNGRLTLLEQSETKADTAEKTYEGNVKVAKAGKKSLESTQSGTKRIIDPHDVATTDVLTSLIETRAKEDIHASVNGDIILVNGTVSFLDNKILELAVSAMEHELLEAKRHAHTKPQKAEIHAAELIIKLLKNIQTPSAFLLSLDDGTQVGGVIKESGMEDLISTYHFKYGAEGLSDVYLVGIKEVPRQTTMHAAEKLFGASQQMAQGLRQVLFPEDSIRVTPLALFRPL